MFDGGPVIPKDIITEKRLDPGPRSPRKDLECGDLSEKRERPGQKRRRLSHLIHDDGRSKPYRAPL